VGFHAVATLLEACVQAPIAIDPLVRNYLSCTLLSR
jgi:hypothetical protein